MKIFSSKYPLNRRQVLFLWCRSQILISLFEFSPSWFWSEFLKFSSFDSCFESYSQNDEDLSFDTTPGRGLLLSHWWYFLVVSVCRFLSSHTRYAWPLQVWLPFRKICEAGSCQREVLPHLYTGINTSKLPIFYGLFLRHPLLLQFFLPLSLSLSLSLSLWTQKKDERSHVLWSTRFSITMI